MEGSTLPTLATQIFLSSLTDRSVNTDLTTIDLDKQLLASRLAPKTDHSLPEGSVWHVPFRTPFSSFLPDIAPSVEQEVNSTLKLIYALKQPGGLLSLVRIPE